MADTVENEAARLGSLTSRLLRTARLDSEEIKPRMELLDLTSLIGHILRDPVLSSVSGTADRLDQSGSGGNAGRSRITPAHLEPID